MQANAGLAEFLAAISSGRDGMPVNIDEAQQISGLSREGVLKRFRQLQDAGEGYLRLGRHGHPTRFYFRSHKVTVPARANGAPVQMPLPEPEPQPESAGQDLVSHRYQLRQGLSVSIDLPADLTEREASRLARFIETLPL